MPVRNSFADCLWPLNEDICWRPLFYAGKSEPKFLFGLWRIAAMPEWQIIQRNLRIFGMCMWCANRRRRAGQAFGILEDPVPRDGASRQNAASNTISGPKLSPFGNAAFGTFWSSGSVEYEEIRAPMPVFRLPESATSARHPGKIAIWPLLLQSGWF
ncbi:hypothetical protein [Methylocaldum marinum]|uniref:hypothetical protein n=1 Tax=Methylocaldum marinum TaxID=1432792 RepID=UPI0011AE2EE4|nr:hypothetical protein [Methylocaldum marinum]